MNGRLVATSHLTANELAQGGLCLGMTRCEVAERMESIIAFSELTEVIDRPFKTYSSGMMARLTFATAMSVEPDILILDEALSVGDLLFAERCYARIRQLVRQGATVLFVTHSLTAMYELCSSAILLHKGQMLQQGNPRLVGYAYEQLLNQERATANGHVSVSTVGGNTAYDELPPTCVQDAYLIDGEGRRVVSLEHNQPCAVRIRCVSQVPHERLSLAFRIQKPGGNILYATSTSLLGLSLSVKEGEILEVDFEWRCTLASGEYILAGGVAKDLDADNYSVLHVYHEACVFTVHSSSGFIGDLDLQSRAKIHKRELLSSVVE